jgi:carbamoyltransferase
LEVEKLRDIAVSFGFQVTTPERLSREIAHLLNFGETVALFQGRSESGSRALGNRSIVADPRRDSTRWHINFNIKGREWFRPLAPVVLLEKIGLICSTIEPSPYMLFKHNILPEWRRRLGAVTHIDGSARPQTVSRGQNELLYDIICWFEKMTGVPVLLNTSFNGKGEPIVESADDALSTFLRLPIDHLAIGPILISKKPPLS